MRGYRIVEIKNGKILSLFHGTNGSRALPMDTWIRADQKVVSDGSSGYSYLSGFHFLPNEADAIRFFDARFRNKRNRVVVPCWVRGNIRIKNKRIKPPCWLAEEIRFNSNEIQSLIE